MAGPTRPRLLLGAFCLVVFAVLVGPVNCFNVGTSGARIIQGRPGTHFGATVNFLPEGSKYRPDNGDIALLVSATNEEATPSLDGAALGVMHVCKDIFKSSYSCSNFHLDDNLAITNASAKEHFGSAVALNEDGTLMVCSPQWMDTNTVSQKYTFMPGRCSVAAKNKKDDYKPFFNVQANWSNYVRSIDGVTMYYQGTSIYGFSVDAKKGNFFVAGAPGLLDGEGTVVYTDLAKEVHTELPVKLESNYDTTAFGYLGYAVKIGSFCDEADLCFAASAPNLNRVGMVKIIKRAVKEDLSETLEITQLIEGQQAWSYFGYTLAACDVNNDRLDELLVGAPHQTDTQDSEQGFDQGRVHVYSRSNSRQTLAWQAALDGSRSKFSRFGSAIQCIGDLNLDGFIDVAVGAPGEDTGDGSVYIYLGSASGLSNSAAQKIKPSSLPTPIRGLGYAISGPQKVQSSNYPVFAVSSIAEDAVVVFGARPVITPSIEMYARPKMIDIDEACPDADIPGACFIVTICPSGVARDGGTWDTTFTVDVHIDTKIKTKEWKRALFRHDNGTLDASMLDLRVKSGDCLNLKAAIQRTQVNQDRFSPVLVEAQLDLVTTSDDSLSPVLDALVPRTKTKTVTFRNKCGENNKCEVDLDISGELNYGGHEVDWTSAVVNETKELLVEVTVNNKQETNYWTVIEITVNVPLPFNRPTPSSDPSVICKATEEGVGNVAMRESKVICNYYKPLESGSNFKAGVAFDTYWLPLDKAKLEVKAKVMPQNVQDSQEMNWADNTIELSTDVRIIAHVTVNGISTPSEVTIQNAKRISLTSKADIAEGYTVPDHDVKELAVAHRFLVRNDGPSLLLPTKLRVSVPMVLQDASLLVHRAGVKLITKGDKVSECRGLKNFDGVRRVISGTTRRPTAEVTVAPGNVETTATADIFTEEATTMAATTPPTTTVNTGGLPPTTEWKRRRRRGAGYRLRRSVEDEAAQGAVQPNIYLQSCQVDPQYCQVFECDLTAGLAPDAHAEVNVSLGLDKDNIPVPEDFNTFYYAILTEVVQPDHMLFTRWEKGSAFQSVTKFHLVHSGGKINIWIIIGSIIAGLVVITIVALILWKTGFFKRDKHQTVANFKRESQRRSRLSSAAKSDGPSKGPEAGE